MVKCDYCGAPATLNVQETSSSYSINNKGNYNLISTINVGDNDHYCDDCYVREVLR